MSGDAKLDEKLIDVLLAQTPSPKNAFEIQQGILMLLIDAFDRKVTRHYFMTFAAQALAAYSTAGRLIMIKSVADNFKDSALSEKLLDDALNGLVTNTASDLASLREVLALVRQCASSSEQLH
jgi:homospermidine synthase